MAETVILTKIRKINLKSHATSVERRDIIRGNAPNFRIVEATQATKAIKATRITMVGTMLKIQ